MIDTYIGVATFLAIIMYIIIWLYTNNYRNKQVMNLMIANAKKLIDRIDQLEEQVKVIKEEKK